MVPVAGSVQMLGTESVQGAGRHEESGVTHPERLEEPLSQQGIQRLARRSCDQNAKHFGAGVAEPAFARLVRERQGAEAAHPLIRFGRSGRRGRPNTKAKFRHGRQDRLGAGRGKIHAQPKADVRSD